MYYSGSHCVYTKKCPWKKSLTSTNLIWKKTFHNFKIYNISYLIFLFTHFVLFKFKGKHGLKYEILMHEISYNKIKYHA